jgi:hypothetical protein
MVFMESISNETSSLFINYINGDLLRYIVYYYIKL